MALVQLNLKPDAKALRVFGITGLVVFGFLGWYVRHKGGIFGLSFPDAAPTVGIVLWIVAGISGVAALAFPKANFPLYVFLTLITLPIGFVVSYVVLFVLYYLLLTPVGLFFKLIGRDAMKRKLEPGRGSYWEKHVAPASVDRYFKQF